MGVCESEFVSLADKLDIFTSQLTWFGEKGAFCFPLAKFRIELRDGDVLLFNPGEPHCKETVASDHVCVSYYSRKTYFSQFPKYKKDVIV